MGQQRTTGDEVARPEDVEVVLDGLRRHGAAAVVDGRGTGRSTLLDAVAAASGRQGVRVVGRAGLADVPLGTVAVAVVDAQQDDPPPRPAGEVARLVAALVGDRRGLVLVDDAHLLHPRDLAVLAAVRGTGTRLVLTATDEAPWPEGLEGLLAGIAQRRVGRLDLAGVRALVERVAGGTPDRARAYRLLRVAGGRPGHVHRLLGPAPRVADGLVRLPPDPAATDAALGWYRQRTVGDDVRRLARLVVREDGLTVRQLAALTGQDVLDVAHGHGLVELRDGRLALRDPLVAAVAARHDREVHGAADAALLLDVLGDRGPDDPVDRWRAEAGLALPPDALARVVMDTVEQGRPGTAVELAGSPVAPSSGSGDGTGVEVASARLAVARVVALTGAGRHDEALAACEQLLPGLAGPLRGQVALLLADLRFFRRRDAVGALAALAEVPPEDPLRPDAEAMAGLVRNATDPAGRVAVPRPVEDLAPTPRMLADLLAVLAGRVHGPEDVHVPPPDAGPPGVPVHERALTNRNYALLVGRGCAAARPVVEAEVARVLLTGRPGAVALALFGLAELEHLEGCLVDAERTAREALLWTEVDDEAGLADLLVGMRAGLLAELGRLEEARALLDEVTPRLSHDLRALLVAGGGRVRTLAAHDRAAARAAARGTVEVGLTTGHVLWALRTAVDAARVGLAADVVDLVGDLADDDRLGALLRAEAHVVRAFADGRAGVLAAAADACAAVGRRRVAADLLLARLPVPEARRRRAAALLDGLGPPHPDRAGQVEALTGREDQVARLAAAGLTSRAVAERLGVSVRTVDNHLRRAYRKLGVSGRGDLAAVLGTTGLG